MTIHLHMLNGCFCLIRADLSGCANDCLAENIYYLAVYRNCVPLLSLHDHVQAPSTALPKSPSACLTGLSAANASGISLL